LRREIEAEVSAENLIVFCDKSLGLGYSGGVAIILALLVASLAIWYRAGGSVSAQNSAPPEVECFYW
jgi:uncharacterized membrane-anchored protein